jgi:FkbM family methyltransferase
LYRSLHPKISAERRAELAFYGELLQTGDLCFDIGANLGQRSEVFMKLGARVVAVEPNPLCEPTIRHELGKDSGRFTLLRRALGATAGERVRLNIAGTDSTASVRTDWQYLKAQAMVEVETITVDAMVAEFGMPRFVKIDVEGYEDQVLAGLTQTVPLLSFEYHVHGPELARAERCLDRLCAIGTWTFRAVPMDCSGWATDDWLDADAFRAFLRSGSLSRGDAFARARTQ